jgi:DNA-binding response OmpR family regulator
LRVPRIGIRRKPKMSGELKRILIVEDEAIMRESLRDWLTDCGYDVDTAEEGEEALNRIDQRDYGIVILDLRLPGKDGVDVLQRARLKRPDLKGIIVTAYPSVPSAVRTMKEGAIDYLSKPLDLPELERVIEETFKTSRAAPIPVEKALDKMSVEETAVISPERVPVRLRQAKACFEQGLYPEALREFEAINQISPGNLESWVWARKTREALIALKVGVEAENAQRTAPPKECLWVSLGLVRHRVCDRDYACNACDFDRTVQEELAAGGLSALDRALEKFKEFPGSQRLCRYALKDDLSGDRCVRLFHCSKCEFTQIIQEEFPSKLTALESRRKAVLKVRHGRALKERKCGRAE